MYQCFNDNPALAEHWEIKWILKQELTRRLIDLENSSRNENPRQSYEKAIWEESQTFLINIIGDYLLKPSFEASIKYQTPDPRTNESMTQTIKWDDKFSSNGKIFKYESKKEKINLSDE